MKVMVRFSGKGKKAQKYMKIREMFYHFWKEHSHTFDSMPWPVSVWCEICCRTAINRRINVKLKNLRRPHDLVLQMIKSRNLKFYWIYLAQNCKFSLWRIYLYLAVNKTKFFVNVFITSQYYIASMIGIFSRKTLIQKSWKIAEWVRLFLVRLENHMNTLGSSSNFTSNIKRF